jgi:hypothetical protein
MLDGRRHQVPHGVTGDAACGGQEAHGFPVTAVKREGDPHSLAIVAADLEAIGTPAPITFIDRDAAVMPALGTTGMAIEQKAMDLHHPVDPLLIRRLQQRPPRRIGRPPLPDEELVAQIKAAIAELPTYGYRRVHAILKRQALAAGLKPLEPGGAAFLAVAGPAEGDRCDLLTIAFKKGGHSIRKSREASYIKPLDLAHRAVRKKREPCVCCPNVPQ